MARKFRDPEAPEVLEAILERMRQMTREEWIEALAYRPEGAVETWRMQRPPEQEPCDGTEPLPERSPRATPVDGRRARSRPRKTPA